MESWKKRLIELFPPTRESFDLGDKVGIGIDGFWHQEISSGIVLPIKRAVKNGKTTWLTPYEMTYGGLIKEYRKAKKEAIIVPPRIINARKNAYLISINPAPGLKRCFEKISDEALTGLIAHELAEVSLAIKEPNYHERITHHNLPEAKVDQIAAKKGYKKQVRAYLELLMGNVNYITPRPKEQNSLISLLETFLGVNVISLDEPQPKISRKDYVETVKLQINERITSLN